MRYSVKFYLERRKDKTTKLPIEINMPVNLSVFYSGIQVLYFSGKKCNLKQWDQGKMRMKKGYILPNNESSITFNADLTKVETSVNDLFKAYEVENTVPDRARLRSDLDKLIKSKKPITAEEVAPQKTFFEYFKQYNDDAPLSPERKKHMKTTLNKVTKFNPYTTFEIITTDYLTKFQKYLKEKCNLSENTTASELKRLRAFLGFCVKNKWISSNPFSSFSIKAESYGDPIFITVEERDKLFSAEIDDPKLARVRDLFVFQCFIGCRVGDLVKLKKTNIINGCIEYVAAKTKDEQPRTARVPLSEKAKTILSKYDFENGDLLPYITDQKYNVYLKELFKLKNVNLIRIVTIVDPKTRASKPKSIADLASSHMARRVFVGSLHHLGVKNEIIASMSGHTANSKAFSRYYSINDEDRQKAIDLMK